jgi:AAA+ superfamily predicted ATPase
MTSPADSLRAAVTDLVAVASATGVSGEEARAEGLRFAAAIAESAPSAALDWAPAAGLDGADSAAANGAFFEAASGGRKWRQAPTALLSDLVAIGSPQASVYAARLADVAAAACLLGEPTPRVAGNASLAAAAQMSAAPATGAAGPAGPIGAPPMSPAPASGAPASPPPTAGATGPAGAAAPVSPTTTAPVLGVGDPNAIPNLTELMLDNQRRVQAQLEAITRLRGEPAFPIPGHGGGAGSDVGGGGGIPPGSPQGPAPASPPPPGTPGGPTGPSDPTQPDPTQPESPAAADPGPPPKSLEDLMAELDGLVGLAGVKKEVHQQVAILKVEKKRHEAGLKNATITRHLVFVGNPGTGKTTVARLVGGLYRALGLLSKGQLVEVDRSELVAGYLGQTAIKTSEVVAKALGGVLFIDEAYGLSGDQYGQEAINTLVKEMEDHRDDLVVIVAGYPTPMMEFIAQNPGLASRFKTIIEFADYTDDELVGIIDSLAGASDYDITPDAEKVVREILAATDRNFTFGNGRFVRNLLEEAIGRHAWRLRDATEVTTEELRSLLPQDFRETPEDEAAADPAAPTTSGGDGDGQDVADEDQAEADMTAEGAPDNDAAVPESGEPGATPTDEKSGV